MVCSILPARSLVGGYSTRQGSLDKCGASPLPWLAPVVWASPHVRLAPATWVSLFFGLGSGRVSCRHRRHACLCNHRSGPRLFRAAHPLVSSRSGCPKHLEKL